MPGLIKGKKGFLSLIWMQFVDQSGNFPEIVQSSWECWLARSNSGSIQPIVFTSNFIDTSFSSSPERAFILPDKLNAIISNTSVSVNDVRHGKAFFLLRLSHRLTRIRKWCSILANTQDYISSEKWEAGYVIILVLNSYQFRHHVELNLI